jgi:putative ABC transport system substrate-binding protein
MRRIGYVTPAAGPNPVDEEFLGSLQQLGWVRDRNIKIEYRSSGGRPKNIAPMIAEVVGLELDLLVVWGQQLALSLIQAAPRTAMVFLVTDFDPIEGGLVSNLAHPGGNVTGISVANIQIIAKRLQLLKEAVPTLTCVAVLFSTERTRSSAGIDALAAAAVAFTIKLDEIEVETPLALEEAIHSAKGRGAQALYVWPTGFAYSFAKQISEVANANGLPSIHYVKEGALAGCLLSYAADLKEQVRRGAAYADKILRGTAPGNLAVEQMSKYELVINLNTAKKLGLTLPPSLLARADEVIE